MEPASLAARDPGPLEPALLGAAAARAAAAAEPAADPSAAIDRATGVFHDALPDVLPSVFVLEHGRLWLVAQRGYAVVPDGIRVETGIMGRAVRLGRPELVSDVREDPEYVAALPGVRSELAVPLRAGGVIVGALNLESERPLPDEAPQLVQSLTRALAPLAASLGASRTLDLAALARLFVHLSSQRDVQEIAALAAASLSKILPVEASQVVIWSKPEAARELAAWQADDAGVRPLPIPDVVEARSRVDSSVVCRLLDLEQSGHAGRHGAYVVWFPLRANGEELGALVGVVSTRITADPAQLDTAALLAAHVAASLDGAAALERERQSAVTDSLTGIFNRRGLEEQLDAALGVARVRRTPMSVLVIDCDDFKDINDRAGHGFGDALLVEVARILETALPENALAGRLGGDEFVVVLPDAGVGEAKELGLAIGSVLLDGLADAGFPLSVSGGISTYPFDGATSSMLIRAADQALYAAKDGGKDRIVSFRDVVRRERAGLPAAPLLERWDDRRSKAARTDGSVLAEAMQAAAALEAELTADGVCDRLCKALVFVVGATACLASRFTGELVVDVASHALRDVSLGAKAAYRLSDFPLTSAVLESGDPLAISFLDDDVDPAEAFLLRELEMNALLMIPLHVRGAPWGLVELYEMRLRRFTTDDAALARFLTKQAEQRLEELGADEAPPAALRPVYELPSAGGRSRGPRTR